jgi:putative methylase
MQKRLVRKLDLERALSLIEPHTSPKAYLEQYTTTPEVAAELLYIAAYTNDDITDKTIADLGCGTGRLAIGSVLLGAEEAVGIDLDKKAVKTAHKNARKMGVEEKTQWVIADIAALHGTFETVLQNPPFGVQRRRADRRFLEKALEIGGRIYSIHKSSKGNLGRAAKPKERERKLVPLSPSPFLEKFIAKNGGKIMAVYTMPMIIPRMFGFHTKRRHQFPVDLYIIETSRNADPNG